MLSFTTLTLGYGNREALSRVFPIPLGFGKAVLNFVGHLALEAHTSSR